MTLLKSLNIIGAGGHARSVIALLLDSGFTINGIYDDSFDPNNEEIVSGFFLKGKVADIPEGEIILAVGQNELRKKYFNELGNRLLKEVVVASSALVEKGAIIDSSSLVFHQVLINADAKIGKNCIINSKALIEHESVIGDDCHISIGSIIGGRVEVGNNCFIGAGAIVKDQISICDDVTIGAGGVVVKSIFQPGTYVGNPLRKIK